MVTNFRSPRLLTGSLSKFGPLSSTPHLLLHHRLTSLQSITLNRTEYSEQFAAHIHKQTEHLSAVQQTWSTIRCANSSVMDLPALTIQRLATGWTVQGSNAGGCEIFRTVQTGPGAHPASCKMGTGSFLWE